MLRWWKLKGKFKTANMIFREGFGHAGTVRLVSPAVCVLNGLGRSVDKVFIIKGEIS